MIQDKHSDFDVIFYSSAHQVTHTHNWVILTLSPHLLASRINVVSVISLSARSRQVKLERHRNDAIAISRMNTTPGKVALQKLTHAIYRDNIFQV